MVCPRARDEEQLSRLASAASDLLAHLLGVGHDLKDPPGNDGVEGTRGEGQAVGVGCYSRCAGTPGPAAAEAGGTRSTAT